MPEAWLRRPGAMTSSAVEAGRRAATEGGGDRAEYARRMLPHAVESAGCD